MLFLPITYAVVCWQDNETQYRLCDAAGEVYKNFYDMCEYRNHFSDEEKLWCVKVVLNSAIQHWKNVETPSNGMLVFCMSLKWGKYLNVTKIDYE